MTEPPDEDRSAGNRDNNTQHIKDNSVIPFPDRGVDETPPGKDNTNSKNRRWYVPQDIPMFLITFLGFIAVCVYTCYARQQVIVTQKANKIAVKALKEANEPFITWSNFNITRARSSQTSPYQLRVGPVWTNWGNTPASSAKTTLCAPIIRDDAVFPRIFCHITDNGNGANVIGPKQSSVLLGVPVSYEDIDATRDNRKYIYIFGHVDYSDSVDIDENGIAKPRVTWFCQRVSEVDPQEGEPVSVQSAIPTLIAFGCPILNCSDDACTDIPKSD